VLNPYWNVPHSIATKELLPQLQRDPGALQRQNIRIFNGWGADAPEIDPLSVDWPRVTKANFKFRLRQDAGNRNALGRIKFMFPNRFAVYIHDTPSKRLFGKARRFFSHGCMRVQDPLALAEVLLREIGSRWTHRTIESALDRQTKKIVRLRRKIPVHVTYLTAWVNKDMSVHFRKDIYDRDKLLDVAIKRSRLVRAQ
jgi:murein L,D-transpeptidase YcbB/YkuD